MRSGDGPQPIAFRMLECASLLVPACDRTEWLAEWTGELTHILRPSCGRTSLHAAPFVFSLGAFADAVWLRRDHLQAVRFLKARPASWIRCLGGLITLLFGTWACSHLDIGFARAPFRDLYDVRVDNSTPSVLLQILIATCTLPAVTSLEVTRISGGKRMKTSLFRAFLFLKASMIVILCHYVGLCVTHLAESLAILDGSPATYRAIRDGLTPLQFLTTFASCLFGLRWTLIDQRRRCPVCLEVLSSPSSSGLRARTFLTWSRNEEICPRGHGLMAVPEFATSWFSAQTWHHLESFRLLE